MGMFGIYEFFFYFDVGSCFEVLISFGWNFNFLNYSQIFFADTIYEFYVGFTLLKFKYSV